MQRVIIHAWFPHLAAERVRRAAAGAPELPSDLPLDAPLVLTSAVQRPCVELASSANVDCAQLLRSRCSQLQLVPRKKEKRRRNVL